MLTGAGAAWAGAVANATAMSYASFWPRLARHDPSALKLGGVLWIASSCVMPWQSIADGAGAVSGCSVAVKPSAQGVSGVHVGIVSTMAGAGAAVPSKRAIVAHSWTLWGSKVICIVILRFGLLLPVTNRCGRGSKYL